MSDVLLSIRDLNTFYGRIPMLLDVSLDIQRGQVCSVLGANGAGKSTLVKAILNMVKAEAKEMTFDGQDIRLWPTHKRIEHGIQVASSATGTFPKMSVETNLRLGAHTIQDKQLLQEQLEAIYQSFPVLKQRLQQKAGTLSGGERTMLAIARAVINKPSLLIMDEPSLGLSPIMVEEVFRIVDRLNHEEHITILLVEQNAAMSLEISHFAYVIQKGKIAFGSEASELLNSEYMDTPMM